MNSWYTSSPSTSIFIDNYKHDQHDGKINDWLVIIHPSPSRHISPLSKHLSNAGIMICYFFALAESL